MTELNDSTQIARIDTPKQPVVFTKNGGVYASSRDVAAYFGKENFQVNRDIRNLVAKEPDWGSRNFVAFDISDLTGSSTSHYEMSRDGLAVLAMGFTGAKALKWKLKYIEAFNIMEAELRAAPAIDPMKAMSDPAALRMILLSYTEKVLELEAENAELTPKAIALDRIAGTDGLFNLTEAAKLLGQPPRAFNTWLRNDRWIYKRDPAGTWLGYQDKVNAGYLDHRTYPFTRRDGTECTGSQVMFTPKGLTILAKRLGVSAPDLHGASLH